MQQNAICGTELECGNEIQNYRNEKESDIYNGEQNNKKIQIE